MRWKLVLCCVFFSTISIGQNLSKKVVSLNDSGSLDRLIDASGEKKLVLLGEASHGTQEYYAWRDSISRRLISEKGFDFVAVEGDFASLYELNRYVKNKEGAASSARAVLTKLDRWPQWMWANEEIVALAEWLRGYNDMLPEDRRVGFYGMDVYDEWRSMNNVLEVLKTHNHNLYQKILRQYECISGYAGNSWQYAHAVNSGVDSCAEFNQNVVDLIENERETFAGMPEELYFYVLQNARVFKNAEKFYRKAVVSGDASSWNARALHMHETVNSLLARYGTNAKGIVWAHNTHIGDAAYTNMLQAGQKNIGQFSREKWGDENVFLIGFTTYEGKVIAGQSWGAPMQEMVIPKARANSVEKMLSKMGPDSFYLVFDKKDKQNPDLMQTMGNRAVGVVYNPRNDGRQFVPTIVPKRYDAIIFFRVTNALKPL